MDVSKKELLEQTEQHMCQQINFNDNRQPILGLCEKRVGSCNGKYATYTDQTNAVGYVRGCLEGDGVNKLFLNAFNAHSLEPVPTPRGCNIDYRMSNLDVMSENELVRYLNIESDVKPNKETYEIVHTIFDSLQDPVNHKPNSFTSKLMPFFQK